MAIYKTATKEQVLALIHEIIEIDGDLLTDGEVIDVINDVCDSAYDNDTVEICDAVAEHIGDIA